MRRLLAPTCLALLTLAATTAWGQNNSLQNTNVQGSGQGTGATLSSRFSSDFSRFTTGSTDGGVVGAGATQAGMTNSVTGAGATGAGGRAGGTNALGGFALGRGGLGGLGGFGGFGGGFGGFGGFGQQQNQGQTQGQIRTKLVLGFAPRLTTRPVVATRLQDRLNRMTRVRKPAPLRVVMVGQTAVLEGSVASERDRRIAAQLASFEPGVRSVENRLVVAGATEELPAGPPEIDRP